MPRNRRAFLSQSGTALASLFVVGRLDLKAVASALAPLAYRQQLAGAATFELAMQKLVLPQVVPDYYPFLEPEERAELDRLASQTTESLDGPEDVARVYEAAKHVSCEESHTIRVEFSDDVSVVIPSEQVRSIQTIAARCWNEPNPGLSTAALFLEIEVLGRLRRPETWIWT